MFENKKNYFPNSTDEKIYNCSRHCKNAKCQDHFPRLYKMDVVDNTVDITPMSASSKHGKLILDVKPH
ncbi:hypothetical protein DAPK24_010600 [Pichia kluyveri]|uniref:Uncharacterized protein n=1 Tax=Pichia kluyveri TaxID=36015 RepID=A0AAV5QZ79_PICKL|nr:hypothetical protein DAPK24_010600 [Pichia kluyveri]